MIRSDALFPPLSVSAAPAMIVSGIRAVSALDASATARSNPAILWNRLSTRSRNAGRSQKVSVLSTRSRSSCGIAGIRSGDGHLRLGRGRRIRPAHHAEAIEQAERAGEDRDEQGDLECERSRVGVDADDLGAHVGRLAGELLFELGVAQYLGVLVER